jgi:hypothetical protein
LWKNPLSEGCWVLATRSGSSVFSSIWTSYSWYSGAMDCNTTPRLGMVLPPGRWQHTLPKSFPSLAPLRVYFTTHHPP